MNPPLLVAVVAAVVVVSGLGVVLALTSRRRLQRAVDEARADVESLRARVEALAAVEHAREHGTGVGAGRDDASPGRRTEPDEFVITSLDSAHDARLRARADVVVPGEEPDALPAREFVTVALSESLVRLVSLGYGVRRALSPENRNRIRFEMGREVKRARRQRRRDLKEAKRHVRAGQRPDLTEDAA
jgi:hypothetical protein